MKYIIGLLFIFISIAGFPQRKYPSDSREVFLSRKKAFVLLGQNSQLEQSRFWPHVAPEAFLQNIRRNLEHPFQLNTGRGTNFCSYGALTYTCLKNEPQRYIQCMLDLYKNGEARYRNVHFKPSERVCQAAGKMIYQGDLDIHPADQIWFLSLADHFKGYLNWFRLRYKKGAEDTRWAACNLSKFNRMLRKLCKYKVWSRGFDLLRLHSNDLPKLLAEKLEQGELYLYLNNALLRKKNHNKIQKRIPTHYVVLLEITRKENTLTIKYWDGGYQTLKEITVSQLKSILYGISWVQYKNRNENEVIQ
jgi:hypothetical protein